MILGDVTVRIAAGFRLELHLDTDEANAAGIKSGDHGESLGCDYPSDEGGGVRPDQKQDAPL